MGSISPTEQTPYSSETMRTSSLRLLVASNRSRYAASSSNRIETLFTDGPMIPLRDHVAVPGPVRVTRAHAHVSAQEAVAAGRTGLGPGRGGADAGVHPRHRPHSASG